MREQFEAWMTSEQWFHEDDFKWDESRNCYAEYGIHIAFKAYQAGAASMQAERDQLAAECAALKKSEAEFNDYCREECAREGYEWEDDFTETPATERFLAEQRAQGVEMFADQKQKELFSLHPDTHAIGSIAADMSAAVKELREFAAQLRNEVKV